uniref:tumor necrosis factor receptor superfamily member 14-like n=1 Tax=Pristiophorus japonicus TaxID=55135 RepID=UPI00398E7391
MVLLWILMAMGTVHCHSQCSELQYRGESGCCSKCSAGSYVEKDCTGTTETICARCEENEYTDTANGMPHCLKCPNCAEEMGLTEMERCTATSPRTCRCAQGFHCEQDTGIGECRLCKHNVTCPSGEGAIDTGTDPRNIVCEPCADGFFSSLPSQRACQPWTRCEELGKETVRAGTLVSDAECGEQVSRLLLTISLVLAAAVVCSLSLLLIYIWRSRHKDSLANLKERIEESKPSLLTTHTREQEQRALKAQFLKPVDV